MRNELYIRFRVCAPGRAQSSGVLYRCWLGRCTDNQDGQTAWTHGLCPSSDSQPEHKHKHSQTTFVYVWISINCFQICVFREDSLIPLTSLSPLQNLSKVFCMLPPFCIEMTRQWSSSFTHTRKFFSLLCQIPRPSGQSRTALELTIKWPSGFWNRKWSYGETSLLYTTF